MTHGLAATERIADRRGRDEPLTRHYLRDGERGRDARGAPSRARRAGHRPRRQRRADARPQAGADERAGEVVPLLRELVAGQDRSKADDAEVRIRWATGREPIMMAATGPKNLRLAGALADIVMVYVGVNPVAVRWAVEHVRAGAEEAGRDPDEVEIALSARCGSRTTWRRRLGRCRWAPAACANHIGDVMRRNPDHGMPDEMTRLVEARDELRLLRGPSGLVGGAHRLPDGRAGRRLRDRGPRRAVPGARSASSAELGVDEISARLPERRARADAARRTRDHRLPWPGATA